MEAFQCDLLLKTPLMTNGRCTHLTFGGFLKKELSIILMAVNFCLQVDIFL